MKVLFSIIILSIFFVGCGTKRQYFKPAQTDGSVKFDGSLPSPIKEITKNGALLKNGQIVTSDGLEENIIIEKGHSFLGKFDNKFVTTSPDGNLYVKDENGDLVYSKAFSMMVASASVDNNSLALVTSDNSLYLFDMKKDEAIYQKKLEDISVLDSRIASPYFLGSLVIYPTLDGKLSIIDRYNGDHIRDIIVSAGRQFNNIIFLDIVGDRMFAATAKRIIGISPRNINYLDDDIKDAILLEDRLFVFTKDGKILLTDLDLKVKNEQKHSFAIYSGAIFDGSLYAVEKRGYLIKSDLELNDFKVYNFPAEIENLLFTIGEKIYYGDRFYNVRSLEK